MWRAWGIILLLFRQDLAAPFASEVHEMSFRPPAGWTGRVAGGPFIVRYGIPDTGAPADPEKKIPPWGLMLSHLHYRTNPTPLESFVKQAKDHIQKDYKGAKMLEEKSIVLGGRAAFRIVFEFENTIQIKTVLPRTNLECYLLDASLLKSDEGKYRKIAEESIASFRIVPMTLSGEEIAAELRTTDLLKSVKIQPSLLGERWHSVWLVNKQAGHMRTSIAEAQGRYVFEVEVRNDFGEGNVAATVVRGSFSPDGRSQKVETEQTKTNDKKERWQFRASAVIEDGRMKAVRDMNGVKEEKTVKVEDGVLLDDVADVVRRSLVLAGKGTYLLKILSPFADEWNTEMVEVNGAENLELDGVRQNAHILFSKEDRRRTMTYYVAPDGAMIRQGGVKDAFSIRASTKEAALGGGK